MKQQTEMKWKATICIVFLLIAYCSLLTPAYAESEAVVRPKIGLALGGGGARGAAHIGVLRTLEKENIPVDYLVGTSAGALIAALYSGGVSPDELEDYVLSGAIKKVYKTNLSILRAGFFQLNKFIHKLFRKPFYAGLYNDHKLHHFVNQTISTPEGTIDLAVPLHIIAVDLITGLPVVIKSGDVGLAVQASTAIPTIRQPIPIGDQLLIDGGILKNIPAEEVRKMGADIVIAIDVDSRTEIRKPEDFKTFQGVVTRVINLGLRAQAENILNKADVIISPNLAGIGILDLDVASLAKAIKAGEEETIRILPKIEKQVKEKASLLKTALK